MIFMATLRSILWQRILVTGMPVSPFMVVYRQLFIDMN